MSLDINYAAITELFDLAASEGRSFLYEHETYALLNNSGAETPPAVLPILKGLPELRFESVELTETRMYLKCVTPQLKFEMAPGDIVQAGIAISNSEVGQGTLSVQPLLFRLVCRNGLIVADRALRKTHVGRALAQEDEGVTIYQDDTLQADDKAFFLKEIGRAHV